MDLLTNGTESIRVGVEDYTEGSHARLISAVRNIHAGVLLLFKEVLRRHSPSDSNEVLVKARIEPLGDGRGEVRFVGVGKKTAEAHQVEKRLKSLGILVDWAAFKRINEARNEAEHYYSKLSQEALGSVIVSALHIIRDFADEIEELPRTLLGSATWDAMLQVESVHKRERAACDELLEQVEWDSEALRVGVRLLKCLSCGSELLHPAEGHGDWTDTNIVCRVCGAEREREEFVPAAVAAALEWESYVAMTDGGEDPIGECPSCGTSSYVLGEDQCALCGEQPDRECRACGNTIPASELGCAPLCGYCHHMSTKHD